MDSNYIQLQQKLQGLKASINEISRIIEKKSDMVNTLKEQQIEINKKIAVEEESLNENIQKKNEYESLLSEATNSYKQLEDAVSSILNMINNKS